jgi:Cu/Ag efflux protein CusF
MRNKKGIIGVERLRFFLAIVAGITLFGFLGCGQGAQQQEQPAAKGEQRYQLRGVVLSVERADQRIVVDHEEIPGFMAAMAMPYPVEEPAQLDVAGPGDQITAEVVVSDTGAHMTNIVVVRKAEPGQQPGGSAPQTK